MINIALPKGRLGERAYALLSSAGYACGEYSPDSRKLVFCDTDSGVSYFWVKPADVAVYVERGAADVGVAGKDILLEYSPDVYELSNLETGKCSMCVAAPDDWPDDMSRPLRVATKFVNVAKRYFDGLGRDIEIIKLNGSIELAPIVGLSEVIVDIVETGSTLRENGLTVLEEVCPLSARVVVNQVSMKMENQRITRLLQDLNRVVQAREAENAKRGEQ